MRHRFHYRMRNLSNLLSIFTQSSNERKKYNMKLLFGDPTANGRRRDYFFKSVRGGALLPPSACTADLSNFRYLGTLVSPWQASGSLSRIAPPTVPAKALRAMYDDDGSSIFTVSFWSEESGNRQIAGKNAKIDTYEIEIDPFLHLSIPKSSSSSSHARRLLHSTKWTANRDWRQRWMENRPELFAKTHVHFRRKWFFEYSIFSSTELWGRKFNRQNECKRKMIFFSVI